ncbi:hypothetical protein EFD56_05405 [Rhizobium phaseoli]|nr:hypothetical protein EFD56_05405 [Rhizobium phaseoli]
MSKAGLAPHANPLPVLTGRGNVPCENCARNGEVAAYSLLPAGGRRCRQADEGQRLATALSLISRQAGSAQLHYGGRQR